MTANLLYAADPDLGGISGMQLAYMSEDRKFLSNRAAVRVATQLWLGTMIESNTRKRVSLEYCKI